jgi:hypothetical protein
MTGQETVKPEQPQPEQLQPQNQQPQQQQPQEVKPEAVASKEPSVGITKVCWHTISPCVHAAASSRRHCHDLVRNLPASIDFR